MSLRTNPEDSSNSLQDDGRHDAFREVTTASRRVLNKSEFPASGTEQVSRTSSGPSSSICTCVVPFHDSLRYSRSCLLVPQSLKRINSRRSLCRPIASENRGANEDGRGQRQHPGIIGLGLEQKRFD